jgi:hypothetical protein
VNFAAKTNLLDRQRDVIDPTLDLTSIHHTAYEYDIFNLTPIRSIAGDPLHPSITHHTQKNTIDTITSPNMPTTRRKAAANPSTRNQSTLSFNNKSARITKPSLQDTPATQKAQSKLSEPVQEVDIETPEPETAEVEVKPEREEETEIAIPVLPPKKRKTAKATGKSERELVADKITDAQIKKYWKAEEDARLAPRGMPSPLLAST